jgi:hypothetical protein
MANVIRPQIQPSQNADYISPSVAASTGSGLGAAGAAVSQFGNQVMSQDVSSVARDIGNAVSQYSADYFDQTKKAERTAVLSNSLAQATLEFQTAKNARIQQQTDGQGNPTYSRLVDDVGTIGNDVSNKYSSMISDPEARAEFDNRFRSYVSDQQVVSMGTARTQQIQFGRTSLDNGLKGLAVQGANADFSNVGSYENQGIALIDDSLQAGLISPEEHGKMVEEFTSLVRTASLENTIAHNRAEAQKILQADASKLGISEETKSRLMDANNAAIAADAIQAKKAQELQAVDQTAQKAAIAETLKTKIQTDTLREDELILNKDNIDKMTYESLKSQMVKKAKESQAKRDRLATVSNRIAAGQSVDDVPSGDVDEHYNFMVESAVAKTGAALTLPQKAEIAAQYPGKVNAISRELNATLQNGSPGQAAQAVQAYSYLRDKNSRALEGNLFTGQSERIAVMAELLNQQGGVELPQAISLVRDRIKNSTEELRAERQGAFGSIKDFKLDKINNTVAEAVGAENWLGRNYGVSAEAAKTFKELAKNLFVLGADENEAISGAAKMMSRTYGVSEINGDKQYMQAPPERIYGVTGEELRQQLDIDLRLHAGIEDVSSVSVKADLATRGQFTQGPNGPVENITYAITHVDEETGIEVPVLDSRGVPLRWSFDKQRHSELQQENLAGLGREAVREARAERQGEAVTGPVSLGEVSAKYESGKSGPGTVSTGSGDPGGKSYGTHQLASKTGTLQKYVKESKYASEFEGLKPGSAEFDAKWKELAARDPQGFAADQKAFITKNNYEPARKWATRIGMKDSPAVNEAIFSISVQHGKANSIISSAKVATGSSKDSDIVKALFKARRDYVRSLGGLTSDMKASIMKRYDAEEKDILQLAKD